MPALGVMNAQVRDLGTIGCGQECFEVEILGSLSRALNDFVDRALGFLHRALAPGKGPLGCGKASPARSELFGGQLGILFVAVFVVGHGHQQIKGAFPLDVLDELAVEMFAIRPVGSKISCGFAVVEFQQAAQSLTGLDFAN
jgi:hypothetical protein